MLQAVNVASSSLSKNNFLPGGMDDQMARACTSLAREKRLGRIRCQGTRINIYRVVHDFAASQIRYIHIFAVRAGCREMACAFS